MEEPASEAHVPNSDAAPAGPIVATKATKAPAVKPIGGNGLGAFPLNIKAEILPARMTLRTSIPSFIPALLWSYGLVRDPSIPAP